LTSSVESRCSVGPRDKPEDDTWNVAYPFGR
jgi:hypothetical protein